MFQAPKAFSARKISLSSKWTPPPASMLKISPAFKVHGLVALSVFIRRIYSLFVVVLPDNKPSPGIGSSEGDQDSGAAAGRKRRWGSSTAVTTKKPSISITTDSLKVSKHQPAALETHQCCYFARLLKLPSPHFFPQSLIPDIRPSLGQDAVVDLHPEEAVLSGAEDEERERSDQDLQIRRTVTQVCA